MGAEDAVRAFEARVAAVVRADRVPGLAVAVVRADGTAWCAGFGVTDLVSGTPVTEWTPFLWFSMTKIVTATAAVRLAALRALDLDAPVTSYFPAFAVVRQPRPVTVRQLLGHCSGLANPVPIRWVRPAGAPAPNPADFVERLLAGHRRLRYAPGTRASYSNLGYLVLGEVIAAVTGMPYERHVRTELLPLLGMRCTGFAYADTGDERPASGHQPVPRLLSPLLAPVLRAVLPPGIVAGRQGGNVVYQPFHVLGAAYGGLVGGVADAARLALVHLNDGLLDGARVLPAGVATRMREIAVRGGPLDVGLGWYRPAGGDRGYVEHYGGGSGFWNVIRLYPDHGLGVVAMGNTTRYRHEVIMAAAEGAW